MALLTHIRVIHKEVKGEYGWPRMWRALQARGIKASKERVRKMMKQYGICARGKCKFVVTTDSKHNLPIAPNQTWTGDITYIQTDEGWLYSIDRSLALACKIICVLALWLTRYGWRGSDVNLTKPSHSSSTAIEAASIAVRLIRLSSPNLTLNLRGAAEGIVGTMPRLKACGGA